MSAEKFQVDYDNDGRPVAVMTDAGAEHVEGEDGVVEFYGEKAMQFGVAKWPDSVGFRVLEDGNTIVLDAVIEVTDDRVTAHVSDLIYRKYWDQPYGAGRFAEALERAIEMRAAREGDVSYGRRDDDGAWIALHYEISSDTSGTAWDAYLRLLELNQELWGHAERLLEGGALDDAVLLDERRFTIEVLIPLFRSLGFRDISYNHGRDEYGRDVTFSEFTPLGLRRNYGVQVKAGNVSGEAASKLDGIIGQIRDAFAMPYVDVSSRDRRYVTDVVVIISGRYTHNAKEKIVEKAGAQNIYFLDIDKVQELLCASFSARG